MGTRDQGKNTAKRGRPYEKPTLTKLTPEQAKLKLLGHASKGDKGAQELLELMFPETSSRDPKPKSKSA
jgi:hypothetical protein